MRFCDFFSGIGGFRVGLERAGHKGVWVCEIDDFCRKIYSRHYEEPQGKDINDVKAEDIPEAELWCGGFPCQDLSVAGKRAGLKAKRSGLYWTWHRLIKARRPSWLLIENVPGLLSSNDGGDFRLLLSSLIGREVPMPRHGRWPDAGFVRGKGMEVAWRILDAQYFGLAQRRRRVFVVRHLGDGGAAEVLFERQGMRGDTPAEQEAGGEIARTIKTSTDKGDLAVAHTITSREGRHHDPTTDQYIVAPTLYASGAGTERTASAGNEAQFVVAGFMAGQGSKARSIAYREEQSPTLKAAESGSNRAPCIVGTLASGGSGKRGWFVSAEAARDGQLVCAAPPDPDGMRAATGIRRRIHTPDSPRYKALGNAVAVPAIKWIGDRLRRFE